MPQDNDAEDRPDLKPDAIVERVLGKRNQPRDLIAFAGYLGESDIEGHHRLFVNQALTHWVDIRDADIVYRERIPEETDAYGARSILWVRSAAVLLKGEVKTAKAEAEFIAATTDCAIPCEPDERSYLYKERAAATAALTPPGRTCC